jgi:GNAT superfamily N-acetyltransferase
MTLSIVPLQKGFYERSHFTCKHSSLENYFRHNVTRDIGNRMAQCFVLVEDNLRVKGFYTLSSISIPNAHWDDAFRKKHKIVYDSFPCTLLGRLAVDKTAEGRGYGKLLLMHALKTALEGSRKIGSFAVVVDPIDADAGSFYRKFEFVELSNTHRMFMSMKKIESLFG